MADIDGVRLGDVAQVTVGHVGPMASAYVNGGIPFLRSLNVRPHRIDPAELKYITPEFHESLRKSVLRPGDVVTVRTGKPGQSAVVPEWIGEANCSDLVITRPGPRVDAGWLSYYLNWITDTEIAGHLVGAVQQHFNVRSAQSLILPLLALSEQQAIADVLGALDDKVAANDRVVTLADFLAAALTEWALSPDVVPLADLAAVTMGSSPPGTSYNQAADGVPFYQGVRDFGTRFPARRVWTSQPVRLAETGDTLLSVRAPVGQTNLANEELCIGRGLAALRSRGGAPMTLFHQVRAAQAAWAPYESEGTVFGAINRTQLESIEVPAIDASHAAQLEERLVEIESLIASLLGEKTRLAATRDELLPLLMLGKIRVKDAEKSVEELL